MQPQHIAPDRSNSTCSVTRKILIATTTAVLAFANVAPAAQIGLKFGANGNGGLQTGFLLPTDQAGAPGFEQTNWMSLGRFGDNGTAQFNVVDSAGNNTGLILNWDATGNWSVQGAGTATDQGTPDKNMLDAYVDSNGTANTTLANTVYGNSGNNKPLIYISGLSAWLATQSLTNYDLVLYVDGDATQGRTAEYWIMNASGPISGLTYNGDMTTHVFTRDFNNFTANPTYQRVPFTANQARVAGAGNYTVFTGLSADSLLIRTAEFSTGTPRCNINAIQIVPRSTPLPAQIDPLPASQAYAGANASFRPAIAGVVPMAFQWLRDGTNLVNGGNVVGATSNILTLAPASLGDAASYSLIVSNASGVITSSVAPLSIVTYDPGSFAEKVATNYPVAYWRLNESADPSSGFVGAIDYVGGFNGVYGNSAQNGFNSVVGPAPATFPGFESGNTALRCFNSGTTPIPYPSSYVSWVVGPPLNLNTNTVTIAAWIYPTANQAGSTAIVFERGSGNDVCGFGFGGNNNLGYTWSGNGNTFNFTYGSPGYPAPLSPPLNTWSLVALVVSPTNAAIYLCNAGGQFAVTNVFNHTNMPWAAPVYIGDDPSSTLIPQNRAFAGSIDEVSVFNRSLPASEIFNLYKAGLQISAIPPVVAIQPKSAGLLEGRTARFSILASGETPLTYQWRRDGTNLSDVGNISGSGSPSLTVSSVAIANDAASYDIVVTNIAGSITSVVATLSIVVSNSTPTPYESKLRAFNPVAYWRLGEANGSPYSYDYWGGIVAANEGGVTLGVNGPQPPDFNGIETTNTAGAYDGLTGDAATSVSLMNNLAQFSVIGWFNTAGTIGNRVGLFGQNDVVEFGFHGNGPDGVAQVGVFTPRASAFLNQSTNVLPGVWYLIAAVATGTNVNLYLASTNGAGGVKVLQSTTAHTATTNYGLSPFSFKIAGGGVLDVTGNYFTGIIDEVAMFNRALSVGEMSDLFGAALFGGDLPPSISTDPVSQTLYAGRTATFSVSAVGTSPVYRWRTNGVTVPNGGNVSGAATPTLTVANVTTGNAATYDVVITNRVGSVTSAPATLTVVTPATTYESAILGLNPVAYYRLNELGDPTTNAVANEYWGGHAGVYGAATSNGFNNVFGPLPPLFTFEANNYAVAVQSPIANSFVTAPFGSLSTNTVTMCMWVNPTGTMDAIAGLLMNRNAGIAGGFGYIGGNLTYTWNNNNAATYNATYGGHVSGRSDLIPPNDEWSFVALVVEPAQATIYMINQQGMRTATNILAHTSDVFGNNWQIGHDANDGAASTTRNFNGSIDEVAVFNYALSPTQLGNLYSLVGPAAVTLSIANTGPNLVVSWNPAQGTLLEATNVAGPWNTNLSTSPYTVPATNPATFYRVRVR